MWWAIVIGIVSIVILFGKTRQCDCIVCQVEERKAKEQ